MSLGLAENPAMSNPGAVTTCLAALNCMELAYVDINANWSIDFVFRVWPFLSLGDIYLCSVR